MYPGNKIILQCQKAVFPPVFAYGGKIDLGTRPDMYFNNYFLLYVLKKYSISK